MADEVEVSTRKTAARAVQAAFRARTSRRALVAPARRGGEQRAVAAVRLQAAFRRRNSAHAHARFHQIEPLDEPATPSARSAPIPDDAEMSARRPRVVRCAASLLALSMVLATPHALGLFVTARDGRRDRLGGSAAPAAPQPPMAPPLHACAQLENRTNLVSLPETVYCYFLDDTRPDLVSKYGTCETFYVSYPAERGAARLCYWDLNRKNGLVRCRLSTVYLHYRLGDMFLHKNQRVYYGQFHLEHFPTSLAAQYLRATGVSQDYDLLARLIRAEQAAKGGETPPADAVVVHLRVGDILDMAMVESDPNTWSIERLLAGDASKPLMHYTYPIAYYEGLIGLLPSHVRRAVICGGCQFPNGGQFPRSWQYINSVARWLAGRGFTIEFKMARNPDVDVVYMAQATHFLQGGGGFSVMIGELVRHMGGSVYHTRQYEDPWRARG